MFRQAAPSFDLLILFHAVISSALASGPTAPPARATYCRLVVSASSTPQACKYGNEQVPIETPMAVEFGAVLGARQIGPPAVIRWVSLGDQSRVIPRECRSVETTPNISVPDTVM